MPYAGGHKHHFLSLLSVISLETRRKPWTKHLAKKNQEGLLYCSPSMAGFSSLSQRWRLTGDFAKDQITGLYASTNHNSRYDVDSSHVDWQTLIFIFIVFLWQAARTPCIDALPSALLLRLLNTTEEPDARRQHTAEFARRSMEIRRQFNQARPARERHQGVHTVAVVMATTHTTTSVKPWGVEFSWNRHPRTKRAL
jgi:hypothetical protein